MIFSCGNNTNDENILQQDFEKISKQAEGTTVRFFMWGGAANINNWIDQYVAVELKNKYNITLVRVPADASIFINKLLAEKQAGKKSGTMDLLWINGENFKNARENDLLFGPFLEKIPNYRQYVDPRSAEYEFDYPVDGYEVPYGRAQFVFEYDSAAIPAPRILLQLSQHGSKKIQAALPIHSRLILPAPHLSGRFFMK